MQSTCVADRPCQSNRRASQHVVQIHLEEWEGSGIKDRKWHLKEAIAFYQSQGAPHDQQALQEHLTEVQKEKGGVIPKKALGKIADAYDVKKFYLRVVIRQSPELHLED